MIKMTSTYGQNNGVCIYAMRSLKEETCNIGQTKTSKNSLNRLPTQQKICGRENIIVTSGHYIPDAMNQAREHMHCFDLTGFPFCSSETRALCRVIYCVFIGQFNS